MRDEAISARFYSPEASTFMDEVADLAERLCAMIGYSFVRRPISWPGECSISKVNKITFWKPHKPKWNAKGNSRNCCILPERWSLLLVLSTAGNG